MQCSLKDIPTDLHTVITREDSAVTVKDIAGKTVGRVPANVCKIFRKVLQDGAIANRLSLIRRTREKELRSNWWMPSVV